MLSYRHAFHAGNYADVLKHTVLVQILRYMLQKDKPICYFDTHAGAGFYDLTTEEANKTAEYHRGIELLWQERSLPQALDDYRECVKAACGEHLTAYPGSPWFAQHLLRPQDRLVLCELHPADRAQLEQTFGASKNVQSYAEDGWQKSLALIPPPERRGLVLIDPSYELKEEYGKVVEHVKQLHRKFATGVYAIWYPIADPERTAFLLRRMRSSGIKRIVQLELGVTRDHREPGMTGTGMIVINPPWNLAEVMQPALEFFARRLGPYAYSDIVELAGE
jgi:23S rRNA (adenine2030-N6)-methyltransferase